MRPSEKGHVPLQAGMYLTEAYKLRPQIDRPNNHKLDNQGWLGRADAAVELRYTENINFNGCCFKHLGEVLVWTMSSDAVVEQRRAVRSPISP